MQTIEQVCEVLHHLADSLAEQPSKAYGAQALVDVNGNTIGYYAPAEGHRDHEDIYDVAKLEQHLL